MSHKKTKRYTIKIYAIFIRAHSYILPKLFYSYNVTHCFAFSLVNLFIPYETHNRTQPLSFKYLYNVYWYDDELEYYCTNANKVVWTESNWYTQLQADLTSMSSR